MEGSIDKCNLTSTKFNYSQIVQNLQSTYGFEKIGEGGFGVVLGAKSCAIKIIKDIKRCKELVHEKEIYQRIEENKSNVNLIGRIPQFNIYKELTTYCHFNTERILPPLSEYDTGDDDQRAGYVISSDNDNNTYQFKDLKAKRGIYNVDKNDVHVVSWRKIIHFYINHYNPNFKEKSEERGDILGMKPLIEAFTENKVMEFCFAIGQLLAFLIIDCDIFPFDIEVVVGTSESNREVTIYMYDFNECTLISEQMNLNLVASEAARSMYAKDGKNYFPNNKNPYYPYFYDGFTKNRPNHQVDFIDKILDHYNNNFKK